jgi:beta-glucanase (GH16 family)
MLGADIDSVRWPRCGEIDIMENIGKEPSNIYGTLHGPGTRAKMAQVPVTHWPTTNPLLTPFSVCSGMGARRYPLLLRQTSSTKHVPPKICHQERLGIHQPFFILLNVAVGGDWPGSPDATTSFPQEMLVDYVRVYQRD